MNLWNQARNLKLLLYLYEMMAGLKINSSKSKVVLINDYDNPATSYANIINCRIGYFSLKYLGKTNDT